MAKYNFPETLIGDNIILEKLSEFHVDELYEVIDNNREHIGSFLPWLTPDYNKESLEEFVEIQNDNWENENDFGYVIINKETDLPMGSIGVFPRHKGSVEFGYYLGLEFTGKGYITEAVDLLTDYCFNETIVERIGIATIDNNPKSQSVAIRNGFLFEGKLYAKQIDDNGDIMDMLQFVKLKDESKMEKLKSIEPQLIDLFDINSLKNN